MKNVHWTKKNPISATIGLNQNKLNNQNLLILNPNPNHDSIAVIIAILNKSNLKNVSFYTCVAIGNLEFNSNIEKELYLTIMGNEIHYMDIKYNNSSYNPVSLILEYMTKKALDIIHSTL